MQKKRLLFIHTGGTLGMAARSGAGPLEPSSYAANMLSLMRGLETLVEVEGEALCNLDSSDLTPAHWEHIAGLIAGGLDRFDGFVVLHGTDTMAYTASALSFLLRELPRPVVLTGAQRPIAELRSDAEQNLIHAAICATMDIPEVGVCFNQALLRGNRATKVSVHSYAAFDSPNLLPLVRFGVDIEQPVAPLRPTGTFQLQRGFSSDVMMITLFPGASARLLDRAVDAGASAVILRAFGSGNIPRSEWPQAIGRATQAGVPVVVRTQCLHGAVELGRYAGSAAALENGALSAFTMTDEATLVRAMFLRGQGLDLAAFRDAWAQPLAGEF